MEIGISRRASRLLGDGSTILLPLDGALIDGPLGATGQIAKLLTPELLKKIDCVLGFAGLLKRLPPAAKNVPYIVNLSSSTVLGQPTQKVLVGDVQQAVSLGADGVCFQMHISDDLESSMLHDASQIVSEANRYGMPVLLTVYPRKLNDGLVYDYSDIRSNDPDQYTELVTHCVRIAAELGADIIKTAFPGSAEGIEAIAAASLGVPILIAGGSPVEPNLAIERATTSVLHGAKGVAFGRQLFLNPTPDSFVSDLRKAMSPNEIQASV